MINLEDSNSKRSFEILEVSILHGYNRKPEGWHRAMCQDVYGKWFEDVPDRDLLKEIRDTETCELHETFMDVWIDSEGVWTIQIPLVPAGNRNGFEAGFLG